MCIWVRGKAQSWTRALYTAWPQSEFSVCDQTYSRLPCNAQVGKEKESLKKKKKIRKWAPCQVFIEWKIGAPERNKCLELLTLLPYHIPTQSDGHTHLCQNMPRYWVWRQVSSLTGYGIMCWGFIWVLIWKIFWSYLMPGFLMPPFSLSFPCPLQHLFLPIGILDSVLIWF